MDYYFVQCARASGKSLGTVRAIHEAIADNKQVVILRKSNLNASLAKRGVIDGKIK